MMKLYYSPGACSLSPHIVLEELGLQYQGVQVDLASPPAEFSKLNPLGAVPVLAMPNGQALTEGAVIVQYLADQKPEAGLAPKAGTLERYRLQETMNFLATEVHKGFSPLFGLEYMSKDEKAQADIRNYVVGSLGERFTILENRLASQDYLMPWGFTIADAYAFTLLSWCEHTKIDMARWPKLQEYMKRIASRPAVQRTLKAEDLL